MSEDSKTGGEIYKLIGKAIGEIGAIAKDKRNPQQGFMYRGIDQVYNALNPVMAKLGLFLTPEIIEQRREERQTSKGGALIYTILTIRFTVYAPDGSNVSLSVIGEAMDSGDKSTNKAMSVAMKYAMFQLFCIPTEEMIDPDGETHEVAAKDRDARIKAAAQRGAAQAKADKAKEAQAQAEGQGTQADEAQIKAEVAACADFAELAEYYKAHRTTIGKHIGYLSARKKELLEALKKAVTKCATIEALDELKAKTTGLDSADVREVFDARADEIKSADELAAVL